MKNCKKFLLTVIAVLCLVAAALQPETTVTAQAATNTMYQRCVKANSQTGWCIVINKSRHQAAVYRKTGGKWKQFSSYSVTIGAEKTPSRAGTFTIGKKSLWKDFSASTAFYCCYLVGRGSSGYIHSILYKKGSRDVRTAKTVDKRLGVNASKGCIRFSAAAANWIYKNIPRKTKVVIY